MKKQITINGTSTIVETVEELRALDLPIAAAVACFNAIVTGTDTPEVKKFADKNAAAKRLFAVLPEYVEAPAVAASKPTDAKKPRVHSGTKSVLRRLFADPKAAFTVEELLEKTGASYKVLHDDLARLKNPKYSGKDGTLDIVRVGKAYVEKNSESFTHETAMIALAINKASEATGAC